MPKVSDLRALFPNLKDADDFTIVDLYAKDYGLDHKVAAAELGVKINPDGFVSAVKRSFGSTVGGVGELYADVTGDRSHDNALTRFDDRVQRSNPSEINSLQDIADSPWLATKVAAGGAAGFLGPGLAGKAVGLVGKGLGMARVARAGEALNSFGAQTAIAGMPSLRSIGEDQRRSGEEPNDLLKYASGAAVGAVEMLGVQRMLGIGKGASKLTAQQAERAAIGEMASTPWRTAGKTFGGAVAGEAGEELLQNPIEQYAGYKDPTSEKSIQETLFGGAMGAIGGATFGLLGGGRAGLRHRDIRNELRGEGYIAPDASSPTNLLKGFDARAYDREVAPAREEAERFQTYRTDPLSVTPGVRLNTEEEVAGKGPQIIDAANEFGSSRVSDKRHNKQQAEYTKMFNSGSGVFANDPKTGVERELSVGEWHDAQTLPAAQTDTSSYNPASGALPPLANVGDAAAFILQSHLRQNNPDNPQAVQEGSPEHVRLLQADAILRAAGVKFDPASYLSAKEKATAAPKAKGPTKAEVKQDRKGKVNAELTARLETFKDMIGPELYAKHKAELAGFKHTLVGGALSRYAKAAEALKKESVVPQEQAGLVPGVGVEDQGPVAGAGQAAAEGVPVVQAPVQAAQVNQQGVPNGNDSQGVRTGGSQTTQGPEGGSAQAGGSTAQTAQPGPSNLVQEAQDVVYVDKGAALRAIEQMPGGKKTKRKHHVVENPAGGFRVELKVRTPAQIAAGLANAERLKANAATSPGQSAATESLSVFVSKHRRLARSEMLDVIGDDEGSMQLGNSNNETLFVGVNNKGGATIAEAHKQAQDHGYVPEGLSDSEFSTLLSQDAAAHISGDESGKVYSANNTTAAEKRLEAERLKSDEEYEATHPSNPIVEKTELEKAIEERDRLLDEDTDTDAIQAAELKVQALKAQEDALGALGALASRFAPQLEDESVVDATNVDPVAEEERAPTAPDLTSEELAAAETAAPALEASLDEVLDNKDKQVVTQHYGVENSFGSKTKQLFLEGYSKWLLSANRAAHKLAYIFKKVAKAAGNLILAAAVAVSFSNTQVKTAQASMIPVQTIEITDTKTVTTKLPRADFKGVAVPSDVKRAADWRLGVLEGKSKFLIVDKINAMLYVFDKNGDLIAKTAVLLGQAPGDVAAKIENGKTGKDYLTNLKPEHRITPAGVFPVTPAMGAPYGAPAIDYKEIPGAGGVTMAVHAVPQAKEQAKRVGQSAGATDQNRDKRLETPTPADNKITSACINVPLAFANDVLGKHFPFEGADDAVDGARVNMAESPDITVLPEHSSVDKFFPMMGSGKDTTTEVTTKTTMTTGGMTDTATSRSLGSDLLGTGRGEKRGSGSRASISKRRKQFSNSFTPQHQQELGRVLELLMGSAFDLGRTNIKQAVLYVKQAVKRVMGDFIANQIPDAMYEDAFNSAKKGGERKATPRKAGLVLEARMKKLRSEIETRAGTVGLNQELRQVIGKLYDAVFKLGHVKFVTATKHVQTQMRNVMGAKLVDTIPLEVFKAAYNQAGVRDGPIGASTRAQVSAVTALDDERPDTGFDPKKEDLFGKLPTKGKPAAKRASTDEGPVPPEDIEDPDHREAVEMFLAGESLRGISLALGVPTSATEDMFGGSNPDSKISHVTWNKILNNYGYSYDSKKAEDEASSGDIGKGTPEVESDVTTSPITMDDDGSVDYAPDVRDDGLQNRARPNSGGMTSAVNDKKQVKDTEAALKKFSWEQVTKVEIDLKKLHRSLGGFSDAQQLFLLERSVESKAPLGQADVVAADELGKGLRSKVDETKIEAKRRADQENTVVAQLSNDISKGMIAIFKGSVEGEADLVRLLSNKQFGQQLMKYVWDHLGKPKIELTPENLTKFIAYSGVFHRMAVMNSEAVNRSEALQAADDLAKARAEVATLPTAKPTPRLTGRKLLDAVKSTRVTPAHVADADNLTRRAAATGVDLGVGEPQRQAFASRYGMESWGAAAKKQFLENYSLWLKAGGDANDLKPKAATFSSLYRSVLHVATTEGDVFIPVPEAKVLSTLDMVGIADEGVVDTALIDLDKRIITSHYTAGNIEYDSWLPGGTQAQPATWKNVRKKFLSEFGKWLDSNNDERDSFALTNFFKAVLKGVVKAIMVIAAGVTINAANVPEVNAEPMDTKAVPMRTVPADRRGAVKKRGGEWSPGTIDSWADTLSGASKLPYEERSFLKHGWVAGWTEEQVEMFKVASADAIARRKWAVRVISQYLAKFAGTPEDPLKSLPVSRSGATTWESQMDLAIRKQLNANPLDNTLQNTKLHPRTPIWSVHDKLADSIKEHMQHVADYIKENVPVNQLQHYDFVRAMVESDANDKRMAAGIADAKKEARKANEAANALPVHKSYPDGFAWVELALPEKLTTAQGKLVKPVTKWGIGEGNTPGTARYVAVNERGEYITNNSTGTRASGATPEEAWLAGQLTKEGNIMGHCIGGYTTTIALGAERHYSLRDPEGESHATIGISVPAPETDLQAFYGKQSAAFRKKYPEPELGDRDQSSIRRLESLSASRTLSPQEIAERKKIHEKLLARQDEWAEDLIASDEYAAYSDGLHSNILQIKGKSNRPPKEKYTQYVQDFITSGTWGSVEEIENANLVEVPGLTFGGPSMYVDPDTAKQLVLDALPRMFDRDNISAGERAITISHAKNATVYELTNLVRRFRDDIYMSRKEKLRSEPSPQESMFSQGPAGGPTGNTTANVIRTLKEQFNAKDNFDRLVVVVQTEAELPQAILNHPDYKPGTKGVAHRGRVFLVAGNIAKGGELSVFLHEAGAHIGFSKIANDADRAWLHRQIEVWAEGNDATAAAAKRALERGGKDSHEVIAYMVEELVNAGVTPKTHGKEGNWLRRIVDLFSSALAKWADRRPDLSAQNLVDMAFGAAKIKFLNEIGMNLDKSTRFSTKYAAPANAPKTVPELKSFTESTVAQMIASVKETAKDLGNAALQKLVFMHDLIPIAVRAGLTSAKGFDDLMGSKDQLRNRMEQKIDALMSRASVLEDDDKQKAESFLRESTLSSKWGYQPSFITTPVAIDPDRKKEYLALSPEARKVVEEIFEHGDSSYKELQRLAALEVNREYDELVARYPQKAAEYNKDRAKTLAHQARALPHRNGPYAPLQRFGDHVVVARSQQYKAAEAAGDQKAMDRLIADKSRIHYLVEFFDTAGAAAVRRDVLAQQFGTANVVSSRRQENFKDVDELPWSGIAKIKSKIEESPDSRAKSAMQHLVTNLYLQMLADSSARKAELNRRGQGVYGSADMFRAFASHGRSNAHFLASMAKAKEINRQLTAMRSEAHDADDATRPGATRVLNEIMARYAQGLEYNETPLANKVLRVSSLWMLLTSPAYYLTNATQPYMMTMPVLGGRYGAKAFTEITKAYGDITAVVANMGKELDVTKLPITQAEKDMLVELRDKGKLDLSMSTDLGRWAGKGADQGILSTALMKLDHTIARVEALNRITTALAAYRLSGGSTEYAGEMVDVTQGNYGAGNAPRFFHKNAGTKLITQFRKYQLIQISLLGRLLHDSFKGASAAERAVARQAFAWLMTQQMVMTGLKGLPIPAVIYMLAAALGGDDDKDWERNLRKWIGNDMIATLLIRGVPAALGLDLSGRIGMGNAFSILPFSDIDFTKAGYKEAVFGLSGAAIGGLGLQLASGIEYMGKGQYYRGVEAMLPRGLKDMMAGYRLGTKGVVDNAGTTTMSADEIGFFAAAMKGVGLPTTGITEHQTGKHDLYELGKHFTEREGRIKSDYASAVKESDSEDMADARSEWMEVQEAKKRWYDEMAKRGFDDKHLLQNLKPDPLSTLLKHPSKVEKKTGYWTAANR